MRWSPNGQYLASADDDANIIIWNLKTDNIPLLDNESNDKEIWVITKVQNGKYMFSMEYEVILCIIIADYERT